MKILNNRRNFLNSLPSDSEKIPLLKIVGVLLLGFLLGIVLLGLFGPLLNGITNPSVRQFLATIVQDIPVALLFIWLFRKRSNNNLFKSLSAKNKHNSILITILSFLLLFGTTFIVFYVFAKSSNTPIDPTIMSAYYESEATLRGVLLSLSGLLLYLVLAFFEEYIFRFMIFRNLRGKGFTYALVVSSLIFAIAHMNIGLPFSFLAGVIFAIHYEYTNNIFTTVLVHALHNYLSFYYASYLVFRLLA